MCVTPSGIITLVRFQQQKKLPPPILVTPLGIVMFVRFVQLANAFSPIIVTVPSFGIMLFLQPAISVFVAVSTIQLPAE